MKRTKKEARQRIHKRIRKKVNGTPSRPRLSVFRSNKEIYCQIIDDINGVTMLAASSKEESVAESPNKTEQAKAVGKLIAERAKENEVEHVVFDRSGYLYHGRVRALAEGAREGGLKL